MTTPPPIPAPVVPLAYAPPPQAPVAEGIGGWIILPTIGLFVYPLTGFALLKSVQSLLIRPAAWNRLGAYHGLRELILLEWAIQATFIAVDILLLVLLFRKSRLFPTLMIIFMLSRLAFPIVDHLLALTVPHIHHQPWSRALTQSGSYVLAAVILVPYFLYSRRVKATFVH